VECTIDKAFNPRELVLQELFKIIVVCYIKNLRFKLKCGNFYDKYSIKNRYSKIDVVVMGVYSGWDSFFLNMVVKFFLTKYLLCMISY